MSRQLMVGFALAALSAHGVANAAECDALTQTGLFANTTVTSAKVVPADAAAKLPSFCEVIAVVSPVPESRIGVVYRLPGNWNGKLLGLGGGGWAGNITLAIAAPGLQRGYATAQTDGGHPGTGVRDTSWANEVTIADFAYRAVHQMTVTGKEIVAKHYGKPQSRAYFQGCSTGGRQGLMEVQRYPADYDGVISGAPVYSLLTQSNALLRNQLFAKPGARMTAEQLAAINRASLAACDAQDGLKDGIVTDPRMCKFDPATLQCGAAKGGADSTASSTAGAGAHGAHCLSAAQVAVVRAAYAGVTTAKGEIAAYPLTRGGEEGWARFIAATAPPSGRSSIGIDGLASAMFGKADFNFDAFDADRDFATMRASGFAQAYEAKDPDITAFVQRGGKLLLWHGWDDPAPSAHGTIEYFEKMRQVTGAKVKTLDDSARLFLAPGVYHCSGGPGPDQFDLLGTLDAWVERGAAPQTMLATKADSAVSRPLCPYPALPRYNGAGNPDDAANFSCR